MSENRKPGWDKAAVNRIAKEYYGGLKEMFDWHGWSTDGRVISQIAPTKVVERYRTIDGFVRLHDERAAWPEFDPKNIWSGQYSVWLKSLDKWTPETWGTVGFSDESRPDEIAAVTTAPFIMVIYIKKGSDIAAPGTHGKVIGFYVLSHEIGHRNQLTHPQHHAWYPEQWQRSFKARKAFRFVPERTLIIDDICPDISGNARNIGRRAVPLSSNQIEILKVIPFVEEPLFGGPDVADGGIVFPSDARTKVRAGPVRRSPAYIPGEPFDTPKELYILELSGDPSSFLGEATTKQKIYKIGLSYDPQTRCDNFNHAMPRGLFRWSLSRSTRMDGHIAYPYFEVAECGEYAMKIHLEQNGKHLGSEFYAATPQHMELAWVSGRDAALRYQGIKND